MENNEKNKINEHKNFSFSKVILDNRKKLNITGVEKVLESNENRIQVIVSSYNLCINGEKLAVVKLDVEKGEIEIEGTVNELKYYEGNSKGNFFKKIFK